VKELAGDRPVLVCSGTTIANVAALLGVADGTIVGSSIKIDSDVSNPVDPDRVERLVRAASRLCQ
jgi:hypothetical protein